MSAPAEIEYDTLPARFTLCTRLGTSPSTVWASISTMPGVNHELGPWFAMTAPPHAMAGSLVEAPLGERAFTSVLLLLGFLPVDLHFLRIIELEPGRGFVECSSSLLQVTWRHERFITPEPGDTTCTVTDRIAFRSRLPGLERLLRPAVRAVFAHRHRRLRVRFGAGAPVRV